MALAPGFIAGFARYPPLFPLFVRALFASGLTLPWLPAGQYNGRQAIDRFLRLYCFAPFDNVQKFH